MKKIIIACSGAEHIAKKIASKLKSEYSKLYIKKFPDNELNIRFLKDVKKKKVILIQSFYNNINEKIIETLFAAYTLKDLKAKKIILLALYFPYLRKDTRFRKGDCISAQVIAKLFKIFDRILIVEPHLHRIKNLKKSFPNATRISVVEDISNYLKKIKNPYFIGPDIESLQWASHVSQLLGKKATILKKKRYTSKKVKINLNKKINLGDKNVIIVDDIISTGHTMLETIKALKRKEKPKEFYCIAVHGIFTNNALKKLSKTSKIVTCNTIPSKVAKIDISCTLTKSIEKYV
jgi:ribose-phosphate pyrophosphokinase